MSLKSYIKKRPPSLYPIENLALAGNNIRRSFCEISEKFVTLVFLRLFGHRMLVFYFLDISLVWSYFCRRTHFVEGSLEELLSFSLWDISREFSYRFCLEFDLSLLLISFANILFLVAFKSSTILVLLIVFVWLWQEGRTGQTESSTKDKNNHPSWQC